MLEHENVNETFKLVTSVSKKQGIEATIYTHRSELVEKSGKIILLILDFSCNIQMEVSEFDANSMKAWIHISAMKWGGVRGQHSYYQAAFNQFITSTLASFSVLLLWY